MFKKFCFNKIKIIESFKLNYIFFSVFALLSLLKYSYGISNIREQVAFSVGQSEFAKHIYAVLSKEKGNILFSPATLHVELASLAQGSKLASKLILENVLGLPNEVAERAYKIKMQELQRNSTALDVTLVNTIFIQKGLRYNEAFQILAYEYFKTNFGYANFNNPVEASESINRALTTLTNNRFKHKFNANELPNVEMLITSVMSFKGKFEKMFDIGEEEERNFHICGYNYVKTVMMHTVDNYKYKFDHKLDSHVIALPFKNNFNLVIILPLECKGILKLEQYLRSYQLSSIFDDMRLVKLDLWMPKIFIEQFHNLDNVYREVSTFISVHIFQLVKLLFF